MGEDLLILAHLGPDCLIKSNKSFFLELISLWSKGQAAFAFGSRRICQ
jgi:hypothetical protein